MSESPVLPLIFLSIRGLCHFLIFVRIFTYTAHGHGKHRQVVGLVAAMFAGLNLAEAGRILAAMLSSDPIAEGMYLPGQMLFIMAIVFWANGNLATFFPKKLLQRLP